MYYFEIQLPNHVDPEQPLGLSMVNPSDPKSALVVSCVCGNHYAVDPQDTQEVMSGRTICGLCKKINRIDYPRIEKKIKLSVVKY